MSSNAIPLQMVKAWIGIDMPVALTADFHQYWLFYNRGATLGALANLIAENDTQLVLKESTTANTVLTGQASGWDALGVGKTIAIDDEPLRVSAFDVAAKTITVERYPAAFSYILLPPAKTHAADASVYVLAYETVFELLAEKYLRPHTYDMLRELGSKSYSLGTLASGTLSLDGSNPLLTAQQPPTAQSSA